jgi:hypothetical protein
VDFRNFRTVVLVDLDSTLADTRHRRDLAPPHNPESTWSAYAKACIRDKPIWEIIHMVRYHYVDHLIHLISGRDGSSIKETKYWLRLYDVPYDRLVLRPIDDETSNADIKVNYAKHVKSLGLDPILLIDDWVPTCDAMEAYGVPVFRVPTLDREPDASDMPQ